MILALFLLNCFNQIYLSIIFINIINYIILPLDVLFKFINLLKMYFIWLCPFIKIQFYILIFLMP